MHYTNNSFFKFFVLFLITLTLNISTTIANYQTKTGQVVHAVKIEKGSLLKEEKEKFIKSFGLAYQHLTVKDLKVPDKDVNGFLNRAFQEEIDDLGKPGIYHYNLTNGKGELVAYFSIESYDILKTVSPNDAYLKTFPKGSYYVRQLYVVPSHQRVGIASLILTKALKDLFPEIKHLYIAVRRLNASGIGLYKHLGFEELSTSLHNLPSERYASYHLELK